MAWSFYDQNGRILQGVLPGSVDTVELADDAVTAAKLANSINTEITANTAKVTNATHTGDVTGATALTIATDAVDIGMLSASGTADSSTFLRGDNAWAAPAGGVSKLSCLVYRDSTKSVAPSSTVQVEYNQETFDNGSLHDNSTNNTRITIPSGEGGVWLFSAVVGWGEISSGRCNLSFKINGSAKIPSRVGIVASGAIQNATSIYELDAGDYVEVSVYQTSSGSILISGTSDAAGSFSAIKISD